MPVPCYFQNSQEYDFEYDLRELDFYAVDNGDDILVVPH